MGCIPTKCLLHSAELLEDIKNQGKEIGVEVEGVKVNFPQVIAHKNAISKQLTSGVAGLLKLNKVKKIDGEAAFVGEKRIRVTKPDGSAWVGGVENPWDSSEVYTNGSSTVAAVKMSDLSLVTSGDYQRYYVVDGKRYHHLIDPDTLFPAAYFNGVTVLCSDSGLADCLTTGLFCQPLEDGMKIVESLDGVEAMWCTPDQQVITSSGWDSHLKK